MAYAAVTSVVKKTEQILHADGHHILHKNLQLKSLLEKCSFLQSLLDDCSSETTSQAVYSFEEQIMGAAYRAETIIDQFSSKPEREENRNSFARLISTIRNPTRAFWDCTSVWVGDQSFFGRLILAVLNLMPALKIHVLGLQYQDMQKLLQDIDSITEEVMKTKSIIEDLLSRNLVHDGSVGLASSGKSTMVGFDDDSRQIKDQLTGSSSKLETVSIFGMGGIGKMTLARNVYEDPLITQKFDTRAWVTVSAQYHVKDILFGLLNSMKVLTDRTGGENDEELAELLYKRLKGWRYLIVMDDVWESKAWDCVKRSFPDDRN
ncbi:putative late blight resistance protein-like protein R1A-10 [Forsythia ovata]|uniref:Late blight resistance protein-like protein R1A-10 n=1 Tax=Forsythia ovata TaxID=205694 RepID=A0ABD1TRY2_9LAMI